MSENEKDNRDFEFIREQVIEKKNKKFKKWFVPFCMMVFMAVVFGLIASVTFCLTEPRLYKFLHKPEEDKTPITFPTEYPDDPNAGENTDNTIEPTAAPQDTADAEGEVEVPVDQVEPDNQEPHTTIIERSLDADIDDYIKMNDEIKKVVYETNKSIVKVSSIKNVEDMFGNPIELTIDTTGVVIVNNVNKANIMILVSLDRVEDSNSIKIVLSEKDTVDARLQDFDRDLNMAVLAVSKTDIPEMYRNSMKEAELGESYTITIGNPIVALGSPNGHLYSMEVGIITSKGSTAGITDNRLELFNTSITDNNYSDGIIINLKGEIIGLITRKLKQGIDKELNTVIGISKIKSAYIARMANQEPRIYFGIKTEDLTEAAKQEYNVDNGIYVDEILANSPAAEAGIKNGDIILQVNDDYIINSNNFNNTISMYKPEEQVKVKIKRTSTAAEKEMEIMVTITSKE